MNQILCKTERPRRLARNGLSPVMTLDGSYRLVQILSHAEPVYTTPPNLPVPESFWMGGGNSTKPLELDNPRLSAAPGGGKQELPRPITEGLCPEGLRKGVHAGCGRSAISREPRTQQNVVATSVCAHQVAPLKQRLNRPPFTQALRRQPNVVIHKRKSVSLDVARGWSLPHVGKEIVQGVAAALRQVFRHNVDKLAYAVKGTGWHYPKVTMGTLLLCLEETG